ncbi:MAG: hypothetical protein IKU34_05810 [Clostridia bacterium]|nr:hypothetical protein [Clostridia bacterium]
MNNKIARRLTWYFAAVLIVFALVTGGLFSLLFTRHTADVAIRDIRAHTISIADTLSHFITNYHEGSCTGGGFKSYTRFVGELSMCDLYLIDAHGEMATIGELEKRDGVLPQEAMPLVERVFETQEVVSDLFFSGLLRGDILISGAPVWAENGEIRYAVILLDSLDNAGHTLRDTVYILGACLAIAMVLAMVISNLLSCRFVIPLYRMKETTAKLINGDYSAKTEIRQNDEIGILAGHIDELSVKLNAAEKERSQLEQMRQDFFSDISHELRTPLAVLKGNIELLRQDASGEPESRRAAYDQLYADANHMQHLVNDLLELTRLQNPHFAIDMDVINLIDVLSDTARSMRQQAAAKQIAIELDDQMGPFPVLGDYARLRQMMIILLDNAIKFSPAHSTVLLAARPAPGGCEISVTDHGTGFDQKTLEHIFDRYFHSRSLTNRNGTGLGLPIAKEIALRHQLEFTCESKEGKGSRFALVFPGYRIPD